ncbi:MAG TPA: hypothetical protein VH599_14080 [Ktedonobacterales bacterium]
MTALGAAMLARLRLARASLPLAETGFPHSRSRWSLVRPSRRLAAGRWYDGLEGERSPWRTAGRQDGGATGTTPPQPPCRLEGGATSTVLSLCLYRRRPWRRRSGIKSC